MGRLIAYKILFIFSFLSINFHSQSSFVDSLFSSRGEQYFSIPNSRDIDIDNLSKLISIDHKTNSQTIFAYANKNQFIDFLKLEIDYQIIEDIINISQINNIRSNWNYYPTYQEYENMMQAFADSFPSICKLHNLGTLSSGHKILAVQISEMDLYY